ncbi:MAG: KTSC domain-containing protein [Rhabdochlamydiaceae bacterium]
MDHQTVKSSNLKSVAFDPDSNTLEVHFIKGKTPYYYNNVTQQEYDNLMQARSKGRYFKERIASKQFKRGR